MRSGSFPTYANRRIIDVPPPTTPPRTSRTFPIQGTCGEGQHVPPRPLYTFNIASGGRGRKLRVFCEPLLEVGEHRFTAGVVQNLVEVSGIEDELLVGLRHRLEHVSAGLGA